MKSDIKMKLFKFNTLRRIIQVLSFIFLSGVVFNLGTLPLLLPVLWTWGLDQNTVGDAFTATQLMFYSAVFPWLAIMSFLIIGVLLGKSLCGWVCPFGFAQDLLDFLRRRQKEISLRTHETMVYIKYGVLAITLFVSVTFSATRLIGISEGYENSLGVFARAPFSSLSPAETLFATLPKMTLDFHSALLKNPLIEVLSGITSLHPLFWVQLIILALVLGFSA